MLLRALFRALARSLAARRTSIDPTAQTTFRHRVLVVEDDTATREALAAILGADGYDIETAASAEEALERFHRGSFHLALVDHQLPGKTGTELTAILAENTPMTGVVLVTGHGTMSSAVRAMKLGALDYVAKPVDAGKLRHVVADVLSRRPRYIPNKLLRDDAGPVEFDGMVARSSAMKAVFERIRMAASTDTTVLILGESGTGKELVARSIHGRSPRAHGPFVPVNTGAIPPELIASELFGHERGAFTGATSAKEGRFELAEKGTIFLDEIDTMDERTQVHLLRVLETFRATRVGGKKERPVDVRVVAATNADLAARVAAQEFREDLYYRLAIFTIELPPLRDRREDVAVLASAFLESFARRYDRAVPVLPDETLALLEAHAWPGNVRELRNVVEQSAILCQGKALGPELLPRTLRLEAAAEPDTIRIPLNMPMKDVEREVIRRTLEANGGNKNRTARILGMSRRALYNKIARYGLRQPVIDGVAATA
jgi:DNA-binding NtrC family response regulator